MTWDQFAIWIGGVGCGVGLSMGIQEIAPLLHRWAKRRAALAIQGRSSGANGETV